MPFNFTNKTAGDLIQSQDWNNAMAAIAALYDQLDANTGHSHTGGPEDGPQLDTNSLKDAAVTLQKLANLAVSAAKIQNNAVTTDKIATNAVTSSKIRANSVNAGHIVSSGVGNSEIANFAVTNAKIGTGAVSNSKLGTNSVTGTKIANGTITAAKLASGVAPEIGIAISNCSNGQTAAIPSGFLRSECRFSVSLKMVGFNLGLTSNQYVNCSINSSTGVVSVTNTSSGRGTCRVLAIGKKGGW